MDVSPVSKCGFLAFFNCLWILYHLVWILTDCYIVKSFGYFYSGIELHINSGLYWIF